MKVEVRNEGVEPYTIDTIKLADRLNDIVGRIGVAVLAIEGAEAEFATCELGPVATYLRELGQQVHDIGDDIHHCPPDPKDAGDEVAS